MSDLEAAALAALHDAGISRGARILVAVSGGPDSTALLRSLASRGPSTGFTLSACTIDHGIRGRAECDADVRFVEALCASLGIPLSVRRVAPGECAARARERRASLEETARDFRLSLLREEATAAGADAIALGHTEDDAVETLLMRVLGGADVEGLRGMTLRRGPFVRPLLRCRRDEVIAYLVSLGQEWRVDATNDDRGFLRNRIRHALVPVLEREFPGYRAGLLLLSRRASLAADLVAGAARGMRWTRERGEFSIPIREFLAAEPAARSFSLLRAYDLVKPAGAPRRLPTRFLDAVVRASALPGAGVLARAHGMVLRTGSGRLSWGPDIARQGKKGYFMEVSATGDIAVRGAGVRLRVQPGREAAPATAGVLTLPACDVKPPLVLRSRRAGDVIALPEGVVSVSGLLAGWKVPARERDRVPILADRDGVLAVLGGALGYRNRTRAGAPSAGSADRMVICMERDMEEGREQQQRQR